MLCATISGSWLTSDIGKWGIAGRSSVVCYYRDNSTCGKPSQQAWTIGENGLLRKNDQGHIPPGLRAEVKELCLDPWRGRALRYAKGAKTYLQLVLLEIVWPWGLESMSALVR